MVSVVERFGFFQFAVLPCGLDEAINCIRAQQDEWRHRPYHVERESLDVRRIILSPQGPQKLPSIEKGRVLFEIAGRDGARTMFVSSVPDGDNSLLHCISRRIVGGLIGVRAETLDALYPMNQLFLLENFEKKRLVRVMKEEDGWDFFEKGEPLWFEDIRHYQSRVKKDRLNPQIVSEYLAKLGYGSLDEGYWVDPSRTAAYILEDGFAPWNGGESEASACGRI